MAGSNRWCLGTVGYHWSNTRWMDYRELDMALGFLCELADWHSCHAGIDLPDANLARKGQADLNRLHWRCLVGTWYGTPVAGLYMGRNPIRLVIATNYRSFRMGPGGTNCISDL